MVNILPFQKTSLLISGIDDYLDKVAEAIMTLEQTLLHYADQGADEQLGKGYGKSAMSRNVQTTCADRSQT